MRYYAPSIEDPETILLFGMSACVCVCKCVHLQQSLMLEITFELLDLDFHIPYVYTLWKKVFKYTEIYDLDL